MELGSEVKFNFSGLIWIYFWSAILIEGVMSDVCPYQTSRYNLYSSSYDKVWTTTECQWGCCYDNSPPCCVAPISMIVGITVGGLIGVAIIGMCCCAVYRRARERSSTPGVANERVQINMISPSHNVIFNTESSEQLDIPHELFDPPPSYEDVMRGKINYGFQTADTR